MRTFRGIQMVVDMQKWKANDLFYLFTCVRCAVCCIVKCVRNNCMPYALCVHICIRTRNMNETQNWFICWKWILFFPDHANVALFRLHTCTKLNMKKKREEKNACIKWCKRIRDLCVARKYLQFMCGWWKHQASNIILTFQALACLP